VFSALFWEIFLGPKLSEKGNFKGEKGYKT
jgi:hypothetical protein